MADGIVAPRRPRPERRRRARRPPRPARSRTGRSSIPPGDLPDWSRAGDAPRRFRRDLRGGRRRRDPAGVRPLSGVPRRRARAASPAADDRPGLGSVPGGDAAYARLVRAPHDARPRRPRRSTGSGSRRPSGSTREFAELGDRLLGTRRPARGDRAAPIGPGAPLRDVRGGVRRRRGVARPGQRGDPGLVRPPAEGALRRRRDGRPRGAPLDDRLLPPAGRGRQPARAATTSTRPRPRRGRATRPRPSPSTRRSPATISRSRSPRSSTGCRPSAGSPARPRSSRAGACTASGCPTRWASCPATSTGSGSSRSTPGGRRRLVVDTGLHAMGWSRDRGDRVHGRPHGPRREQHRQRGRPLPRDPGPGARLQARPARDAPPARPRPGAALGPAFDIRAFHDVVLGQGALGPARRSPGSSRTGSRTRAGRPA